MVQPTPLTRDGSAPNSAGRPGVSAAMRRLLDDGLRFTDTEAELDPEEMRSWRTRLSQLSADLADCVEAPMRNRVMELLSASWVPDDENALCALRLSLAGASPAQLGEVVGISGRTIERIESGKACQVRIAWRLAEHFTLSTTELFGGLHDGEGRRCRTVADLREEMLSPPSYSREAA